MKPHRIRFAIVILALAVALPAAAAQHESDPRAQLAAAYGIKQFNQVEELRYTFNIKLPDRTVSRSWVWEPKKDRVTFKGTPEQGGTVTYDRASLATASEQVKKIDPQFVNDQYWLIFPLRLAWDGATVTAYKATTKLPSGSGEARRMVVKYPDTEGYTPGDVYELFVDKNYRILEWIYRKAGGPNADRINKWEEYKKVGPLTLSLDRQGVEGKYPRVWFTDVAVRLAGKPDWIPAK